MMAEMALIGYKFTSKEDILPYCEPVTTDYDSVTAEMHTLQFCLMLSERYDCWVVCGFAENTQGKLYNSQLLVNDAQRLIHVTRKTFLYDDDKIWAEPSDTSFKCYELFFKRLGRSVKVGSGICMDINW